MPITKNGYYNDPSIGAAAGNLAELFTPVSAQERFAAAKAAEANQKVQLQNQIIQSINNGADRSTIDKMMIGTGGYAPTQSYYSVDQGNLTSRANNADSNATSLRANAATNATSRQNNIADNFRAVQTNTADNNRAFAQTRFGAVSEGASLPALPASVGDMFGLPADNGMTGVVKLGQGDVATTPQGQSLAGAPKPLTRAEVEGRIVAGLSPEEQRVVGIGSTPVKEVVDPATGKAKIVYQSDSVGMAPVVDTSKVDAFNYTSPDGTKGTARAGDDGSFIDTQTNKKLAEGTSIYKATAQGSPSEFGAKTTESQDKTAYASIMAEGPTKQVLDQFERNELPNGTDYQIMQAMQRLPAEAYPALIAQMSPQGQTFYQGVRTALPLSLMVQSGLATTDKEYNNKMLELVPIPGENPAVTKMKAAQFRTFIEVTHGLASESIKKGKSQLSDPSAPAAPTTGSTQNNTPMEGSTATGPNGQKAVYKGGQWIVQ